MKIEMSIQECEATIASIVRFKFDPNPDVPGPYFGSPFVAEAGRKMVAALIEECERVGDRSRADRWRRWREWRRRAGERPVVLQRAAAIASWDDWSREDQSDYLRTCIAPFNLEVDELPAMLAEVDSLRSRSE